MRITLIPLLTLRVEWIWPCRRSLSGRSAEEQRCPIRETLAVD
jgi:hypothetical protein